MIDPKTIDQISKKYYPKVPIKERVRPYASEAYKNILRKRAYNKKIVDQMSDSALRKLYWEDYLTKLKSINGTGDIIKMHPDVSKIDFEFVNTLQAQNSRILVATQVVTFLGLLFFYRKRKLKTENLNPLLYFIPAPILTFGACNYYLERDLDQKLEDEGLTKKYMIDEIINDLFV